ncbi:MAG TPA: nicotinate (nicotinamide) nucleotide adenylyltransferase [Chitinophagaceae bacterium]|nr:nicotinate (nicotinamide) nucleotide adenylyltransferase [Chitinophagaceae bacterium]
MRIGLYFGSFNPIHTGHLIIANHILNETDLQKVWFVLSPQNPFKASGTLLNEYDRLHLVQKAIGDDGRMKASDIEFNLPKPSYTANTLAYLKEKHSGYSFSIIMGSDSFQNLSKWHNGSWILQNYTIYVYERPGFHVEHVPENVISIKAPLLDISATHIRTLIKEGKSIRYLVPEVIVSDLETINFYKKLK